MQEKKKITNDAKGLYIVLAIMVVTIMVISIVTVIGRKKPVENPPIETGENTVTAPADTKKPTPRPDVTQGWETEAPGTESPSTGETPSIKDDPPEDPKDDQQVGDRIYMMPVRGNIIKECSGDLPVYSITMNDYRVHSGVDIGAEIGTPVYAFTDGTVSAVYADPMMGMTLVIDHGGGLQSKYQNLQTEFPQGIEVGKKVVAGDIIAGVGDTTLIELAENTHLHFEITKDGKNIDPLQYIADMSAANLPDENYEG